MKRDFKVGDKVWHPEYGWGCVEKVALTPPNYWVDFGECTIWCGWWELFYDEVELPNPPQPEAEIDWTKVPPGTRVLVRDGRNDSWMETDFFCYLKDKLCPFWVFVSSFQAEAYKYCQIHPHVKIK